MDLFKKNFKPNLEVEDTLKKVSNVDDKQGGTTTVPCTVAVSIALCPTLVCSSKCGDRG
ncbi:class II lanthipeptide, LchA2/BrtA2 family [Marinilactibacillus psychrotolerans]|uniref:class II lanthipeptide, LchA2/BrtA2 family n=1 Tax=Marinilactibacillus psychrotolerans TaxID=191770 RepID=UPI00388AA314